MRTPTVGLNAVVPDRVYGIPFIAELFGVHPDTVRNWLQSNRLKCIPRITANSPYRVTGSELIRLFGEEAKGIPEPSETKQQREKRIKKGLEEIAKL